MRPIQTMFTPFQIASRPQSSLALLVLAALTILAPAARAQTGDTMHAVTYLEVAAGSVSQGVELIKKFRDTARRDAANLEFNILREAGRPNRFVIFEGWKDKAAFDAYDKGAAAAEFQETLKQIRNSPPDRHMLLPHANARSEIIPLGSLYMIEHVDFLGGDPAIASAAAPLILALAEASRKEPAALRYEVFRQPPPRGNHYEVVAAWPDAKAFEAHEAAPHTMQFRFASGQALVWRCNLYDQRFYEAL